MHLPVLISPEECSKLPANTVIVDCRFQLSDTQWGARSYGQDHIANAVYAHLDRDLSGPLIPGKTGRHPLPTEEAFAATVGRLGINNATTVLAYDQDNGPYAARLWWLLRWLGHEKVTVLNGGYRAWIKAGGAINNIAKTPVPTIFTARPQPHKLVSADDILQRASHTQLIDARGPTRFVGAEEPLDNKAGHIPGALNYPFTENLDSDACFLSAEKLQQRFAVLKDQNVISYCGSGVTACHNILAMTYAGMAEPKLYAGSWSEWITDPLRPIATGAA